MLLDVIMQEMPHWYEAGISVCLESSPGQGKTTTLCSAPKIVGERFGLNLGLVLLNGGNMELTDVQGFLVPVQKEGHADSTFTRPYWWYTIDGKPLEAYDGGFLVVDEYDKAPIDVKKILGEGCLSRRLGPHTLPKGWVIWLAGNRYGKDRSGSTKNLDHLINRIAIIQAEVSLDGWTNWANRNKVHPITIGFANANPNIVFNSEVPKEQGPWCTPRSLVRADKYLQTKAKYTGGEIQLDPTSNETVAGMIGAPAQAQYVNSITLAQQMPKLEEIIKNPTKVKVPTDPSASMLICFNLAHKVDKDNADPVIQYVERMPKEFAVTFARAACNRNAQLVTTKAFNQWSMRNASLVAILTQLAART